MNLKGKDYEDFAIKYLKEKGYKIIERNFGVAGIGEIDIIAKDSKDFLIFIEVRARKKTYYSPHETVNKTKISKILKTSTIYLKRFRDKYNGVRYDVISIEDNGNGDYTLEHFEGAFQNNGKYYI